MKDTCTYRLEELCSNDGSIVGKKCANLGELMKGGFRVPPGFALGVDAYSRFMNESGAREDLRKHLRDFRADPDSLADAMEFERIGGDIREIVESKRMPADLEEDIRRHYRDICQRMACHDYPVATRSAGPVSHPGQYETYLFVRGEEEVIRNIIRVWSSTFNARSLLARARIGLPLEYDPIGVAVLAMVDAKAAGVMFTLNPVNGDLSKIAIEGSWGLGEAVVSGSVTPDSFLVDKVVLEIEVRRIAAKTRAYVCNPLTGAMEYQETPTDLVTRPCLTDREVLELAKTAKKVEEYCGCPQDIEWCIAKETSFPGNIFLVQTRPESIWSKKKQEPLLGRKTGWELLRERATTPIRVSI